MTMYTDFCVPVALRGGCRKTFLDNSDEPPDFVFRWGDLGRGGVLMVGYSGILEGCWVIGGGDTVGHVDNVSYIGVLEK